MRKAASFVRFMQELIMFRVSNKEGERERRARGEIVIPHVTKKSRRVQNRMGWISTLAAAAATATSYYSYSALKICLKVW